MKVSSVRLQAMLKLRGFDFVPMKYGELAFVRPGKLRELFESIIIDSQGKRGEAVYASVGVSITKSPTYKVMGKVRLLREVGEDTDRGWTIIEDQAKAKRWELHVANIAPGTARDWAEIEGPRILDATQNLRATAKRYFALIDSSKQRDEILFAIKSNRDEQVANEVKCLMDNPMIGDAQRDPACEIACHLIVRHSQAVEGRTFFGCNPIKHSDLLNRIVLLNDMILRTEV